MKVICASCALISYNLIKKSTYSFSLRGRNCFCRRASKKDCLVLFSNFCSVILIFSTKSLNFDRDNDRSFIEKMELFWVFKCKEDLYRSKKEGRVADGDHRATKT